MTTVVKDRCWACRRSLPDFWPEDRAAFLLERGFRLDESRSVGNDRYWYQPLNRLRQEPEYHQSGERVEPDGSVVPQFVILAPTPDISEGEFGAVMHELMRDMPTGCIRRTVRRYTEADIEAERRRLLAIPVNWQDHGMTGPMSEEGVAAIEARKKEAWRKSMTDHLDGMRQSFRVTGEWQRCPVCWGWGDDTPSSVIAEAEAKDRELSNASL